MCKLPRFEGSLFTKTAKASSETTRCRLVSPLNMTSTNERAKSSRFSRENAINEIKASVSNVQSSVGHLLSTNASTSNQEPKSVSNRQSSLTPTSDSGRYGTEIHHRKRTSTAAFETESPGGLVPGRTPSFKRASSPRTPIEKPYSPPPFSTSEAQTLILRELASRTGLSAEKKAVFQTALSSLKQTLQKSQDEADDEPSPWSLPDNKDLLENPTIPPASLIQWMLQGEKSATTKQGLSSHHLY